MYIYIYIYIYVCIYIAYQRFGDRHGDRLKEHLLHSDEDGTGLRGNKGNASTHIIY